MVIEHIIAGYSIPHNEGAIPLTKEAYDISDPQKRLTDYSKTIAIPENKTVNQIFEHAFDVNVEFQTFDPNLKTSYQIIQDGITAIDGYCELRSITNVDGASNGGFTNAETVRGATSSITSTVASVANTGGLKPHSGDVIYVENRGPIQRSTDQTEDIKVVVKF